MNHEELVEVMKWAIGREVADGDDIDILEALANGYDWITNEQALRMVEAAALAALSTAEPLIRADERKRVEGEIVAWLRDDTGKGSEVGVDYALDFADIVEAGDYRKGEA